MPPVVNKNLRYMYTAHSFFMMMISSCPPCDSMVDNQILKYAFPFKLRIGKDGWPDLIELKSNKTGVETSGLTTLFIWAHTKILCRMLPSKI